MATAAGEGFRPVHDAHAIEQLVATVQFDRPLTDEQVQAINSVMATFQDALPGRSDIRGIGFQFGPGGIVPILPTTLEKPNGVVRTFTDGRGVVVKELRVDRQSMFFRTQVYTRWLTVWEEIRRYFDALSPVFGAVHVSAYSLAYVDKFIWEGKAEDCLPQRLLAPDSPYVTPNTYTSKDLWHCHSGRFLPAHPSIKRLESVNLDCVDEQVDDKSYRIVRIGTTITDMLDQPGYEKCNITGKEAKAYLGQGFPQLHDELKRILSVIISNESAAQVGLYANAT